jgi:hypothetical protein
VYQCAGQKARGKGDVEQFDCPEPVKGVDGDLNVAIGFNGVLCLPCAEFVVFRGRMLKFEACTVIADEQIRRVRCDIASCARRSLNGLYSSPESPTVPSPGLTLLSSSSLSSNNPTLNCCVRFDGRTRCRVGVRRCFFARFEGVSSISATEPEPVSGPIRSEPASSREDALFRV